MKKTIFPLYFSIAFFLISNTVLGSGSEKHYTFDVVKEFKALSVASMDLNKDGVDEFIMMTNDRQLDVRDFAFREYYFSLTHPTGKYSQFIPLPGSNLDTLKMLYRRFTADSSIFDLGISTQGKTHFLNNFIVFTGNDKDKDGEFFKDLLYCGAIKNNAGEKLYLFRIGSGYDAAPRGLLALHANTYQIAWKFEVAPQISSIGIEDSNGDGVSDIYFGSYAPENFVVCNGTDDSHSYLFCVDGDGHLRWRRQFGPRYSCVAPFLINITGRNESKLIAITAGDNPKAPPRDSLMLIDKRNGKILKTKLSEDRFNYLTFGIGQILTTDLDLDGNDEILTTTKSGFVWLFDDQLQMINSSERFSADIHVRTVADLDGDGYDEIVCNLNRKKLVILDRNLKKIAEYPPLFSFGGIVKNKKKNYLLIKKIGKNGEPAVYQLIDFHPVYLPQQAIKSAREYWYWIAGTVALLLLIFWLRTLFVGTAARKLYLLHLKNAELDDDILFVHRRKRVLHIGDDWRRFLRNLDFSAGAHPLAEAFTSKTPGELKEILSGLLHKKYDSSAVFFHEEKKYSVASQYISALKSHILLLSDTTEQEYLKQLKHWALVAQRLAHSIKNPLTTVKLNAEELKYRLRNKYHITDPEIDEYFDAIIGQVKRLKKMSDGFMRFVEFEQLSLKPENLNELILEWVNEWKVGLREKAEVMFELQENLPLALMDRDQFFVAARNVFFNAVESLDGKGKIIISSRWSQFIPGEASLAGNNGFIELQIRDTGCGISAEYLDKVTLPYFTRNKPEGTGLGMSIVQKIIEAHSGKILIHSKVSHGTSVSLWLKVANRSE